MKWIELAQGRVGWQGLIMSFFYTVSGIVCVQKANGGDKWRNGLCSTRRLQLWWKEPPSAFTTQAITEVVVS